MCLPWSELEFDRQQLLSSHGDEESWKLVWGWADYFLLECPTPQAHVPVCHMSFGSVLGSGLCKSLGFWVLSPNFSQGLCSWALGLLLSKLKGIRENVQDWTNSPSFLNITFGGGAGQEMYYTALLSSFCPRPLPFLLGQKGPSIRISYSSTYV